MDEAQVQALDVIPGFTGHCSPPMRLIMRLLLESEGRTVRRQDIWHALYRDRPVKQQPVGNTIAVFVARIRSGLKHSPWRIITIVREGYQLRGVDGGTYQNDQA